MRGPALRLVTEKAVLPYEDQPLASSIRWSLDL